MPILALSASVVPEHLVEFCAPSMDGQAGKPFTWDELYAAIEVHRFRP